MSNPVAYAPLPVGAQVLTPSRYQPLPLGAKVQCYQALPELAKRTAQPSARTYAPVTTHPLVNTLITCLQKLFSFFLVLTRAQLTYSPVNAQAFYFDVGAADAYVWNFVDGGTTFNAQKYQAYLEQLFTGMKQQGMGQVNLSFSQFYDLNAYLTGNWSTCNDVSDSIAAQMKVFQQNGVTFPEGQDMLSLITAAAHQAGLKVAVAFGGEAAGPTEWDPSSLGSDRVAQGEAVAKFVQKYGIDALDFDIELNNFEQALPGMDVFFSTLHSQLNQTAQMTLTCCADPMWATQLLPSLFKNFEQHFDGLNLMCYANGGPGQPYYIAAWNHQYNEKGNIEQWIDILGKQNVGMLHIGFQDAVDYTDPSNDFYAGQYTIRPGSTAGSAAGQIYKQLQDDLTQAGYLSGGAQLGQPFWWPDEGGTNGSRYNPSNSFMLVTQDEADFYKELNQTP